MIQFLQCDPARLGEIRYGTQQKQSNREAAAYLANYDQLVTELKNRDLLHARLF
jgi:hypothetical protein